MFEHNFSNFSLTLLYIRYNIIVVLDNKKSPTGLCDGNNI